MTQAHQRWAKLRDRLLKIGMPIFILLLLSRWWMYEGVALPSELARTEASRRRCSRPFTLSDWRQHWEPADAAPDTCPPPALHGASLAHCLQRRAARTGQRAQLVFIGDSRARIHFEQVLAELSLDWLGRPLPEVFPVELQLPGLRAEVLGSPERCVTGHTIGVTPEDMTLLLACDVAAASELLAARFYWHPLADGDLEARLAALADDCERRAGADCPHMVVLTAGMWYAKPFMERADHVPLPERVLELRRDAAPLAARVRRLAAHTRLLYRLDGPEMTEGLGYRSRVGGVIAAINALMFDIVSQTGGTTRVWASSLPDTLHFYHSTCLAPGTRGQLQGRRGQCRDVNHAAVPVRQRAVRAMLTSLCQEPTDVGGR
ncbi:uncharacterized protein LOC122365580 [Amphibalanus amphitrite]|uniref:uncharacterized protein LOC122365580 n=1 Tax=Amphibalanus amphitrite TaxID=1232801 RepID=UPI001C90B1B1|nr:uncharacterized protein LOC122365580 [Amphibalanus amphitrite]